MTIPRSILRQSATVEPYEGETGAGGPSYGSPVTVICLIQPHQSLVFGPNSRRVQSRALMFLLPGAVIPPESRVTFGGTIYRVIDTSDVLGPVGPSHVEARLG